jgi:hypothetical protein
MDKMGIGSNIGEERGAGRERQGTTGGGGQGKGVPFACEREMAHHRLSLRRCGGDYLLGLNPEGESLTADPYGGRDGSEGRAGLGCLGVVSWSVSVLPKASPELPRRRDPEGYDCVSGVDLGLGRRKAEDTDRVGEDLPGTLLSPWVRGGCGGGDGLSEDDGGKKWRGLPRGG